MPRLRSVLTCLVLFASTSVLAVCTPHPKPSSSAAAARVVTELLHHKAAGPDNPVAFPPPDASAWRPRSPSPEEVKATPHVSSPNVDADGFFSFGGQTLRIYFNEPMAPRGKKGPRPALPGTIRVSPKVAGTARWDGDQTLEFSASRPFNPETKYTVTVGEIEGPTGRKLEGGWTATFRADPEVFLAGKVLNYIPKPGHPRVIAVHPSDGERVGTGAEISVLYDQAVSLGTAQSLVQVKYADGKKIPVTFAHPDGPTFQGVKVDPGMVVLVHPDGVLKEGASLTLSAADAGKDADVRTSTLSVAEPLARTELSCGYAYQSDHLSCDVKDNVVRTGGREVHVVFNNPIKESNRELKDLVSVTPEVPHLSIAHEYYDGARVILTGEFRPSTTYTATLAGLHDVFGGALQSPVRAKIQTLPLPVSVTMTEGFVPLDDARLKHFHLTTRNVQEAQLVVWPVPEGDPSAFRKALQQSRTHEVPTGGDPIRVDVPVKVQRDSLVTTELDLSSKVEMGKSYIATVVASKVAFDAPESIYAHGSEAEHPPVALLLPTDARTLAIHARRMTDATLVHVARMASGEPVAGAKVTMGALSGTTDAQGVVLLHAAAGDDSAVEVQAADAKGLLPLGAGGIGAKELFPDLGAGEDLAASGRRALLLTDRGIYRPGSRIMVKANVRHLDADELKPVRSAQVRVRLLDPSGGEVFSQLFTTSEAGSVATEIAVDASSKIGRHQLLLEDPDHAEPAIAHIIVQVAEFEPPRFAVDVEAQEDTTSTLHANVRARYLFGAPMEGAQVGWTLRRTEAAFPSGPLTDAGLLFRKRSRYAFWGDDDAEKEAWTRSGEGLIGPDGTLKVEVALPMDAVDGPQQFTLEADVSDSSYRHIANRSASVKNPRKRYAGLRVTKEWAGVGEATPVELGVIDPSGKPITGVPVVAKLTRLDWTYSQQRGAGGGLETRWTTQRVEMGRCSVQSGPSPVACSLTVPRSGDYEIAAEVDGQQGGTVNIWAWRDGDSQPMAFPTKGRTLEIVPDKPKYAPGEKAKLFVRSPYPAATAILTTEQGGLVDYKVQRMNGPAALFELPVGAPNAPFVYATVTLLPIGAKADMMADSRTGAVRLPITLDSTHLTVSVVSDKPSYRPGEEATLSVDVKDGTAPDPDAEIALAVVDEGILRLTAFHAKDPGATLRPGPRLDFDLYDSRQGLAEWLERSHVAGDGGGEGEGLASLVSTRKKFLETALWIPDLHTDAAGHATAKLHLPDNLTQFRMMAVVVDGKGKGAGEEAAFTVTKPVMLVPVVPRFALVGDTLEAAAMLHNNTDQPISARVSLGEHATDVTVAPGGHERVGFSIIAEREEEQTLTFEAKVGGDVLDKVEAKLKVSLPGYDENPRLVTSFVSAQDIPVDVPASVVLRGDETISVEIGQNLWPELGARLEYLLQYPHGCVEQTTSSTLPLLAARTILPRIGFRLMTREELDKRIESGLKRLHTMQTASGGLAYWPGGAEPNVFGTAYAMRAVVLAKQAGVNGPSGLLEGMQRYLGDVMLSSGVTPEVQAAIAQSLGEVGALPASSADALFDTTSSQGTFGLASLAIALHSLPGQDDRVRGLLDTLESFFDPSGALVGKGPNNFDGYHYYGSPTRSMAQAAIALTRMRPEAKVLPRLVGELAESTESYTTQATAWSLLALAEQLSDTVKDGSDVSAALDGVPLVASRDLGFGSKEYRLPVARVAGKHAVLHVESKGKEAVALLMSARWKRRVGDVAAHIASRTENGVDVYRAYSTPKGDPIDLSKLKAGDVVRVAIVVRLPESQPRDRRGYLAITDRLAGGFEPIQPDLQTVARVPELAQSHPYSWLLRESEGSADHVELHDDRVYLYFDHMWGDMVAATYLVRATTPGTFALPPAEGELMYEAGSSGYSDAGKVTIL